MSLIPCPECKTQISVKAASCPKCGYPIALSEQSVLSDKHATPKIPSSDPMAEHLPSDSNLRVCLDCHSVDKPQRPELHHPFLLLMWGTLILTTCGIGLLMLALYVIALPTSNKWTCPKCGSIRLIGLDTVRGKEILNIHREIRENMSDHLPLPDEISFQQDEKFSEPSSQLEENRKRIQAIFAMVLVFIILATIVGTVKQILPLTASPRLKKMRQEPMHSQSDGGPQGSHQMQEHLASLPTTTPVPTLTPTSTITQTPGPTQTITPTPTYLNWKPVEAKPSDPITGNYRVVRRSGPHLIGPIWLNKGGFHTIVVDVRSTEDAQIRLLGESAIEGFRNWFPILFEGFETQLGPVTKTFEIHHGGHYLISVEVPDGVSWAIHFKWDVQVQQDSYLDDKKALIDLAHRESIHNPLIPWPAGY